MKYFPLIWAGLWRKKTRTVLTLLSIVVAFLLFGLLQGVNEGFDAAVAAQHMDRINTIGVGGPLPLAALQQVEAVPGVKRATYSAGMLGSYQLPNAYVGVTAVDPARQLDMYPETVVSKETRDAFVQSRTAALVGAMIANKFGWKVGDTITLNTHTPKKDGSSDWTFEIVGIFPTDEQFFFEPLFQIHYDYFDEARASDNGTVGSFVAQIDDPRNSAAATSAIDSVFENSPYQTLTITEREAIESQMSQLADINYVVMGVVIAAFFTLLFLTGNTMMQSVRERTGEFGVLKTLGFSDRDVAFLIVAESVLLCGIGFALGLLAASLLYPILTAGNLSGLLGHNMRMLVIYLGAIVAVLLAAVSALVPAWRTSRLQIVDALAGR